MGEERKVYKVLVGKPEGKRPLGRPRRRWDVDVDSSNWMIWTIIKSLYDCGFCISQYATNLTGHSIA
jgi:hypothetical protein